MNRERKSEYASTAPSFLWLVMFVLVPVVIIFAIAFRAPLPAGGISEEWSLSAIKSLADPSYPELFIRTIVVAALTMFFCILLALPVAYAMARLSPAWRSRSPTGPPIRRPVSPSRPVAFPSTSSRAGRGHT